MDKNNSKLLDLYTDSTSKFVSMENNVECLFIYVYTGQMEIVNVFGYKQKCQRVDLWRIVAN